MKSQSRLTRRLSLLLLLTGILSSVSQGRDPFSTSAGEDAADPFVEAEKSIASKPSKKKELPNSFEQGEKAEAGPKLLGITLTVEYIAVEHRDLSKLIREFGGDADSTALRAKVDALVEAEEAEIIETVYTRSGPKSSRALTESIEEMIYPTEYDPPEIPTKLQLNGVDLKEFRGTPATPAAMETRNVGTTVEFEAEVSPDGETIQLNLSPEIVEFLRKDWLFHPDNPVPEVTTMWMPVFYTMKITTQLRVKSGQDILLATFTPSDRKTTKRVMLFIRAFSLKEKAAKSAKR